MENSTSIIILNLLSTCIPEKMHDIKENKIFLENMYKEKQDTMPIFDKLAVESLNKMMDFTNAKLVFTDKFSWTRKPQEIQSWCKFNGLNLNLYKNWITPKKMSSYRINEVQWWIEENPETNVLLIIDEEYTMKGLKKEQEQEIMAYQEYLNKYNMILGNKRRKSLIPWQQYGKYENFTPFYGIEAQRTISIDKKDGLTQEKVQECWQMIYNSLSLDIHNDNQHVEDSKNTNMKRKLK